MMTMTMWGLMSSDVGLTDCERDDDDDDDDDDVGLNVPGCRADGLRAGSSGRPYVTLEDRSSRCQRGGCRKPGRGFYSLNYLLTGLSPLRFGSQPGCLARRQTRNGLLCPQSVPVLYWTSGSRGSLLALATSPDLSFAAVTSCLSGLHVQSSMPPRSRQRCLIQLPPAKLSTPQRLILAGTLASETDFCRYVSIRD